MVKGIGSSNPRSELATKFRVGSQALLVVYGISVLAGALPANLRSPSWYLGVNSILVSNGPILLVGLLLGILSLHWDPKSEANRKLFTPLTRISRLASRLFIVVAVAQLTAGYFFHLEVSNQQRQNRQVLADRQKPVIQAISAASTPSQLARMLQSLPSRDRPSSTKPSLQEQKQALLNALKSSQFRADLSLALQRRQRLLALAIESLRILVSAVALSIACRAIAQRPGRKL